MSSRKQRTREKILNSAQRLLVKRGYYGVGLEEIAKDAGVSRQAIYLHFKSKADLLVALAQYGDEAAGVQEILRPVLEAKTALEALDAGVTAYAAMQPKIYDIASVTYAARRSDPAAEAAWRNRMAFRRQNMRRSIERLQQEGLLADGWTVDEATEFLNALLSLQLYEDLVLEQGWTMERLAGRFRTVLRRVLVKEQSD